MIKRKTKLMKENLQMKKISFIAIVLLFVSVFSVSAQTFKYSSDLDVIEETDFYKVALKPEVTVHLNSSFTDIRLYDSQQKELPYILHQEAKVQEHTLFVEYDILKIEHLKKKRYTRIVIRNSNKTSINNIVLRVKNADVRKRLKLNASDDLENWYVLKDNYAYNSISNDQNTSEIRVLNFPLSDYQYYELLIDDFFDKPIQVVQAGYYNRVKEAGKYTEVKCSDFERKDTLKETLLKIPLQGNYIDRMQIKVDGPKYYLRDIQLFVKYPIQGKNSTKYHEDRVNDFRLVSNSNNSFDFNKFKCDTLFIRIKNKDNEPLEISEIRFFQLNSYLVAELEKAESYKALYSDKEAKKPEYDLKYFTDSIPQNLQIVKVGEVTKLAEKVDEVKEESGNFNLSSYWLWIVIIFVVALLGYMSYKMVLDMKKNE